MMKNLLCLAVQLRRFVFSLNVFLFLFILLSSTLFLNAANKTFSGPGNFSDATKWNLSTLPIAGDVLRINGACTFDNSASNLAYGNLEISRSVAGSSIIWPVGGTQTLNVASVITGNGGVGNIEMTNGGILQIRTNWTSTNTSLTPGSGTIVYNVGVNRTMPAAITTYHNLTINPSAVATVTLGAATTVTGDLLISARTFATNNFVLTLKGNFTNNATFTGGTSVVNLDGTSLQTINGSASITFALLKSNNPARVSLGKAVTITTLTIADITSGSVFNDGGFGVTTATTLNLNSGTYNCTASTFPWGTLNAGTGTVNYGLEGVQTVAAKTYNNLTLSGSGSKTTEGAITVNGTTAINGVTFNSGGFSSSLGILTMGSSSTIALGAGSHTINVNNSSSASWTGTLSITGWDGTAGSSGTAGKIFVGVGGLSTTQLSNISFSGYTTGAQILASGELVPKVSAPVLAITGSTDHGSLCVGAAATTIQYTISNTGSTASGVTVTSNNVQFIVSGAPTTVASGGSATYNVTFTPGGTGVQSATITVASTTSGSNSPTSSLTGVGNPLPSAAITPNPTDAASDVCYSGTGTVTSVSWAAVSGSTSYDVYFGAGSLPGTVTSNVLTNSYTTGTLLANTTYYWKVVPKNACGGATGASIWTFTTASSTCLSYCAISSINSRPITRVIFDGFNNTSSNANTTTPSYEDFTSISANVQVGQTYSITVEGNTWGNSSNGNTYYYSVYIDWNQNGNFSDAGESFQVGTLNSSTGIDGKQTSINIVIPISASLGNTRMRVIGQFGGYNANSCAILNGSNSYGQAEDYTINIVPACATAPIANCKNITVDLDATGNVTITGSQLNNGSTSSCGNTLIYAVSPSSFTCANLGSNTVTLTVTDIGNSKTATCTATVIVRDVTLPTIANCSADINIEVPFGNSGANVTWIAPTAADNCGVTTFTSTHNSGDFFNLGPTTVTYTANDNSLNTETCSFTVIVTMVACNPMGINANGQIDWISKINVGSFSKTSGATNYSDYTSDVISLDRNTSQNITLTPGFSSLSFDEYWKVWIDLNKDGDYLDSGEELFSGNSTSAIINSIVIPDKTVNTTMRVAMQGYHPGDRTVSGGNITANAVSSPNGEDIAKLIDNATATKYLTFNNSGWVQYRFPSGNKYVVTKYSISSANDAEERDPKDWTLQGSNDGSTWTTIDTRVNEDFPTRFLKKEFFCANTIAYEYYRLNMTNNSGTILQIAELELFEIDNTPYPDPCETFAYGEVEDYSVNIAPACVDGTLNLTSTAGTNAQKVCIDTPITSITYGVGGGATGATVTGLPVGVTSSFNAGIVTISGSPGTSSSYTITTTGTPSPCTEASITGSITVYSLPTVTWSGALTNQCISSSSYTLIGGLPAGGIYSGTGVTGTNFDATTAGLGTKILTYTYTNANGCTNTATNTITVNALPDNTSDGFIGNTICAGSVGTLTFNAIDATFVEPYTISYSDGITTWNQSITTASSTTFNVAVNPNANTIYSLVSITNGNGCVRSSGFGNATAQITVNPTITPTVSIAASPNGAICASTSVTFTAKASNIGGGTLIYNFKVNGSSKQSGTGNTFSSTTLVNNNTVTCDITVADGTCLTSATASSNPIIMVVNPIPAITAMTLNICSDDAFSVLPISGTDGTVPSGTTYNWVAPSGAGFTGGAGSIGSPSSIAGTLSNTTTSSVTATYNVTPTSGTCTGNLFTITIIVHPKPQFGLFN